MATKICTKCDSEKDINDFANDKSKKDGKRPSCKECKSKQDKEYRNKNIEKIRKNDREYAKNNNEKANLRAKKWYENNKEKAHENMTNWRLNNPEKLKECKDKYNEKNKEKMKLWMNNYQKNRYATDINYRIKTILNKRIRDYVRKDSPTLEYLGCDIPFFKTWIEYQFDEFMNWDNLGKYWHFDHVKPCAAFNLSIEEEIYICYNWKNLRPFEKIDNIKKGSKIDEKLIQTQNLLAESFENLVISTNE